MRRRLPLLSLIGALLLVACGGLVLDPSMQATAAGDYTLLHALNEAMPGRGADILRVKAGTPIRSEWRLIVPYGGKVLSGELTVTYRDISKSYPITSSVLVIPLREVIGRDKWDMQDAGLLLASATIRYEGPETEETWKARGLGFLIVTDEGYDPLPIDSGYGAFKKTCRIEYSTAGRSAMECK